MATPETLATIVESIDINAPASAVFAALTEPEQLTQWWGREGGFRTTRAMADVRVGGAWAMYGVTGEGEQNDLFGTYLIVDPPHHLAFTWRRDPALADDTIVRYDLEERNGVTHLTVTHTGFVNAEDHDDHVHGWGTVLGWVAAHVEKSA